MVKHVLHMQPPYGHHHETDRQIAVCPHCHVTVVRGMGNWWDRLMRARRVIKAVW